MRGIIAASSVSAPPPPPPPPTDLIVNAANTTVVDQGGGFYRVTKTGGANGSIDASAVSSVGFPGDFVFTVQPRQADASMFVGLSLNPIGDNGLGTMVRTLWIKPGGGTSIMAEGGGGSEAASGPTYAALDHLFFRRAGGVLNVLKGTSSDVGLATVVHTFTNLAGTVFFDSSIQTANAMFDVRVAGA